MRTALVAALLVSVIPVSAAHAYIGPGIGAGTIGVVLGVIGSILLALFAGIWYPLKRLVKRLKGTRGREGAAADDPANKAK